MVVVDEKTILPPPPAYSLHRANQPVSPVPEPLHPPPFSSSSRKLAGLSDLPSHLLLHIVHRTFPRSSDKGYNELEKQSKTLHWLTASLRLVNRTFYTGMPLFSPRPLSMTCWIVPDHLHIPHSHFSRTLYTSSSFQFKS